MTNQIFCYWLQGFFEISETFLLNQEKAKLILRSLNKINEPLGEFTGWLSQLLLFLEKENFHEPLLNFFIPEIKERLNLIFYHVIDNSYDETHISLEESRKIHKGKPLT